MEHKSRPEPRRTPGLPTLVSSPADVGRLLRELEMIDETMLQLSLRTGGKEVKIPKTSRLMDQIVEINELNLLHPHDRASLKQFLTIVRQTAPVLNISFSVDPPVAFVEKLMIWLRREINPLLLITVGLQPNMGGGCIVRTNNRQFDFSFRQYFSQKSDLLIAQLVNSGAEA